jgi:hypothetical protein
VGTASKSRYRKTATAAITAVQVNRNGVGSRMLSSRLITNTRLPAQGTIVPIISVSARFLYRNGDCTACSASRRTPVPSTP